jgi:hypothetical protein
MYSHVYVQPRLCIDSTIRCGMAGAQASDADSSAHSTVSEPSHPSLWSWRAGAHI